MVDFPPYIKLVPSSSRRESNASQTRAKEDRLLLPEQIAEVNRESNAWRACETVSLVSRENQLACQGQVPTAAEAEEALASLQEQLPALGQAVGDLHSGLDRGKILDLLAPLVVG